MRTGRETVSISVVAFHGRVALITGGGSGLGQRMAQRLARDGARVAIVDRDAAAIATTAKGTPAGGTSAGGITTYQCDVTDRDSVAEVVGKVEAELGPIDRVVHAAGVMPAGRITEMPIQQLLDVMRINYFGTVTVTTAVLPSMLSRRTGDLVIFGSITGYAYSTNMAAYCASKAAVNTFVEILAHEHAGSGLRIMLAAPSIVRTPLLNQAMEHGPKALTSAARSGRSADPDTILDKIESGLERGVTVLTPGEAKPLYLLRRLSPSLFWWIMDKINRE